MPNRLGGRRSEAVLLVALFFLALFPRLYGISWAPPGLNGDEVYNLIDAQRIGAGHWPLFMPGNQGREALYFYILAFSLRLLGATILGLRLPSILLGCGATVLTYLVGRDLLNRRSGLAAAALVAVSLWPIMMSRIGLRAISLTFMTALTVFLLQRGLRDGKRSYWLLGGVALGLTMYTYIPSRVFPLVVLGWLAAWRRRRAELKRSSRPLVLSLLLAALIFAPFGFYMARNPDAVNQRISSMANALERARAGEPEALLASLGGVAQMFSVRGDEEWRYHLAYRPVFDPLTSVFFYAGLLLALHGVFRRKHDQSNVSDASRSRAGQPEYILLLLWLGAMLSPNAVLNANPSFIRAAGAIVPVYLLAGAGFDAVWRWLESRWRLPRQSGYLFMCVGVGATLAYSMTGYLNVWANHPAVRDIYHADQALMGRFLEQEPPPAATRVFIAYDYVYDRPTELSLDLFTDSDVAWFARTDTFPWPGDGEAAWYFIPAVHGLPADILQQLWDTADMERVTFADGAEAFTVYRVPAHQLAPEPQHAAEISFPAGPQLAGYDVATTEVYGGDSVPLRLYWRIPAGRDQAANRLVYVQVHLADATGDVRARAETLLGYPQAGWRAGDAFIQDMELALPRGMLPGPASFSFGLRDVDGEAIGGMQPAPDGQDFLVRSRPLEEFALTPEMTVYDETLALTGASFQPLLVPGTTLNLELDWVALQPPSQNYRVRLQLMGKEQGRPILAQTFELWPERYPPTEWQALEAVTTYHGLRIPVDLALDDGAVLVANVLPAGESGDRPVEVTAGGTDLGELALEERPRTFEAPALPYSADAQFGDQIRLLGYDINTDMATPGGKVSLTLAWQAIVTPEENYTVFNHLLGVDGRPKGQFDSPPVSEAWLTRTWLPGEVVVEEREIPIEPDAGPGPTQLIIGLYTVDDLQRLPIIKDGQSEGSDQLLLHEFDIVPRSDVGGS